MNKEYWIIDDKLIFKPEFNKELYSYYDVISQHNTLIFSNYDNPEMAIKTNNKNTNDYRKKYKYSKFNKKIKLTGKVIYLSFSDCFNQKIELTNNITYLNFGDCFNQKIKLTKNITYLSFGCNFNKELILAKKIKYLSFGKRFNKKIKLTNNITYLSFGNCFNQEL